MIIFGSFLPSLLVGSAPPTLLGHRSRHCHGIITLTTWRGLKRAYCAPYTCAVDRAMPSFFEMVVQLNPLRAAHEPERSGTPSPAGRVGSRTKIISKNDTDPAKN